MGNYDEAMDQLNRALEISPDSAKAHNALGQLHLIIGNLDQALAAFREAADLDPDYPPPVCSLAGAADEQISDQHLATLKAFLERPNLTLQQRKDIHFAVARSLEKKSDWDIAFTHFFEANTIKRDLLIKSEIQSEADVLVRSIGDIKTVFSADFFAKRAAYGIDSDLPVFILGMPRSGTTLVEQILAGHSGVFGAGELDDIDLTVAKLNAAFAEAEKYPFWAGKIDREKSRTIANDYVAVLREKSPDARRIIDKMPFNFFHLGLLALLFPKAKIINCRRNPNDLGLSCYFQNFEAPHRWATELEQIGVFYREYENLMRHWSSVLPIPIIDVDYETLVADSLSEGQRLIAFLGLEWEDQCLAIAETKRPVRTASNWQVRQPIYNTSVERWRPYEAQLEPFIKAFSAK